jgi:putative SOS response-associated peptidase YedK
MRWGLVPYWATGATVGARMINAQAETAAEKPAFKESLERRRCLVPADGFYEWKRSGKRKQPYCFELPIGSRLRLRVFGIAGERRTATIWRRAQFSQRRRTSSLRTFATACQSLSGQRFTTGLIQDFAT